jgi:hypothetical protein
VSPGNKLETSKIAADCLCTQGFTAQEALDKAFSQHAIAIAVDEHVMVQGKAREARPTLCRKEDAFIAINQVICDSTHHAEAVVL